MDKNYKKWLKENFGVKGALSEDQIDALVASMDEDFEPQSSEPSQKDLSGLSLLNLMENIATLTEGNGTPSEQLQEPILLHNCDELGGRLDISAKQALLLSVFINLYPDADIETKDLAKHLGCTNLSVMACYDDIKVLRNKKYIIEHKGRTGVEYLVPMNTILAFRENHDVTPMDYSNMEGEDLFHELEHLFLAHNEMEIDYTELCDTLTAIISSNPQLTFCRQINGYRLDKDAWVLLVQACSLYYSDSGNTIELTDIRRLLPSRIAARHIRLFRHNQHPLLTQHIFEPAGGVLANESEWCLSRRAAIDLLGELCPTLMDTVKKGVIYAETIGTKSLFYPNKTARQISELEDLLMSEKFARVQESLVAHGMRKGFACLFYGAPGTGKTETVLQLARKTGRAIMQVDMSQVRDKFVGESEKNVKQVFTRYRRLCQESDLTPILLLNEADALLSVRLTSMEHSVDQMANAMQNIILQEMENLDGILIATTNLTQNLDAAFDRRFLYKVEFKKPTAEESRHIWQAMLPNLDEENARTLASKYDFSGGQIENIARKQVVSNILHDSDALDMSLIREACDAERLNRQNGHIRITGFC